VQEPPPTLGQHTGQILKDIGYSDAEIDTLRAEGAIAFSPAPTDPQPPPAGTGIQRPQGDTP